MIIHNIHMKERYDNNHNNFIAKPVMKNNNNSKIIL